MPDKCVLRVLIDACLTPTAVTEVGQQFGQLVDAVHVNNTMPPGTSDDSILAWSRSNGRLIITANDDDFIRAIFEKCPDHAGLGCIRDQNTRERQVEQITALVEALLHHLAGGSQIAGHIFTIRKSRRLAVRRLP